MKQKDDNLKFNLYTHWIWTILYALLALTGFSMMGAKFGWMFGYTFGLADFVHRVVAVLFIFLVLLIVVQEIVQLVKGNNRKKPWVTIGKKGFPGFTLLTTILIILSGFLLWFHAGIPYVWGTFGFLVHEFASLLSLGSVVWHIYVKRYILQDFSANK
jgi:cytochrome b subunit of formate dehydrogenase